MPAKASFRFFEESVTGAFQEHEISTDLCMDCQLDILKSIGIPVVLCYPENREKWKQK